MNEQCRAPLLSPDCCNKGWPLRSGEPATLCNTCGTAYGQLVFCDTFHAEDSGWRECKSCGKRLHCGCIASSSLLELLDSGGVKCVSCSESQGECSILIHEKDRDLDASIAHDVENKPTLVGNQLGLPDFSKMKFSQFGNGIEHNERWHLFPSKANDMAETLCQLKAEGNFRSTEEFRSSFSSFVDHPSLGLVPKAKPDECEEDMLLKDAPGSQVQTNLSISISPIPGDAYHSSAEVGQEKQLGPGKPTFSQGSLAGNLVPKPAKPVVDTRLKGNENKISQIRVARPPVEGRTKNQLLPRYWPRITDEELEKISGDSNSTVVPLFEKVLSASDAGRIGRLVLPKACAEAYFPPISQPEGLPLRIHDLKGKEWVFQFRFWPNNNSRMYVLEGVTPCIQSMQLQAGDTVTFSRMDPEGKLLMGFRKASNSIIMQDKHLASMSIGICSSQSFILPATENLHAVSSRGGIIQPFEVSKDISLSSLSKHLNIRDLGWDKNDANGSKISDERKRSRNIGSKNKRLLVDSEDSLKLRLSWEELQDLLRPPSSIKPSNVTIEDHEFEEYDQPPVFGKKSIFTVSLSGEQDQWVQCDDCSKLRRLPAYVLLPPKWTCQDNAWDLSRCSCSTPEELDPKEVEDLLEMSKGLRLENEYDSSDPEGFLISSNIGAGSSEVCAASVATTTKHPRHRVGCSCIVCIQPPSGKGKHKPTCTCTVCMTVKRRFKTLMMRKKKRQLELEAENVQRNEIVWASKEDTEAQSLQREAALSQDSLENYTRLGKEFHMVRLSNTQFQRPVESDNMQLDLNSNPDRENMRHSSSCDSMVGRLQEANLPLETYLKQNGLTSLVLERQASLGSRTLQEATKQGEVQCNEDQSCTYLIKELEVGEKKRPEANQAGEDRCQSSS